VTPVSLKPAAAEAVELVREQLPVPEAGIVVRGGGKRTVRADHGAVTSVERHATMAGVRVLEQGGNAVDAAIAAAYALAVTHPSAGNIGGGGFMLIRNKGGKTVAIDFRETAPAGFTRDRFNRLIADGGMGPASVGIPGTVAGLELARERFGSLPRAALLEDAIKLAEKGHHLGARQALALSWSYKHLRRNDAARRIFGDTRGKQLAEGALLKQPELAKTLRRIAEHGRDGFYRGPTAQALVDSVKTGGFITLDDLAGYRAVERAPLAFRYRGLEVETMPPPSAGGVALLVMLRLLDDLDAHRFEPRTPQALHLFVETSRRGQAERRLAVADPDRLDAPDFARDMLRWRETKRLLESAPIDPERATPPREGDGAIAAALRELENTTHLSVIDERGTVVSLTTTLSAGFGSKIVVPGAGFVLNNTAAAFGTSGRNTPAPGFRPASSMAPTLVLANGEAVLVLGSPGGDTIPSTISQVLRNVVDYGMTLDQAVDAPRLHHCFVPNQIRYERGRAPDAALLKALEAMGHKLELRPVMGDANNLLLEGDVAWAYTDPREGGLAKAARPRRENAGQD
jgi:gamma-glutamyltranspeptidase/glutathione hydrolase